MKMEDIDMAALDKDLRKLTTPKHHGWFRRNWKWVVPLDLLITVVIVAGVLYWVFFTRVYNLDVCQKRCWRSRARRPCWKPSANRSNR